MILSIPCSEQHLEDKLMWHYTKDGEYSVRSGYHAAMSLKTWPETSKSMKISALWSTIWELRVMNKTKIFLWKLSHNWLPTNKVLFCRKILTSNECSRCRGHITEDAFHAIWDCHSNRNIWRLTKFWPAIKHSKDRDPLLLINQIKTSYSAEDLEMRCFP